jgi:iron complex outermembrane receptor protein
MIRSITSLLISIAILIVHTGFSQDIQKGRILDISTKEPLPGASITAVASGAKTISNVSGEFSITAREGETYMISMVGYTSQEIKFTKPREDIYLSASVSLLQELVISANREGGKRSQAPVAISAISAKTIQETRPTTIDQVLNKVSGVNMVSLGNEQHQMSIRQPMTTKSLFLYLEDGVPIRTTGLFNHNALLEMNMAAVKSMEVIKGPSSSLYGSEAIGGVVNFITRVPSAVPVFKLSAQGNNIGYKRADLNSSFTKGTNATVTWSTAIITRG